MSRVRGVGSDSDIVLNYLDLDSMYNNSSFRNVTPPPSTCSMRSTRPLIQCTERWPPPCDAEQQPTPFWCRTETYCYLSIKRVRIGGDWVWYKLTSTPPPLIPPLYNCGSRYGPDINYRHVCNVFLIQAVADMIHELADGAQFITTTFRFLIEIIHPNIWNHIYIWSFVWITWHTYVQARAAWTRQQVLRSKVQE